ncbi:hypothetical protein L873DRAFT_1811319 [Choiromyces venosus 120613-1]|uniref:Uncharacterized protein n=1 Tax=Choiromyces venosus 120613-1 TaxID=1336337 RepID=A0A3N4JRR7_9PEZI|nr:hypothetical protein L873DRAFT_1811319 [Choiromyces venosus 120613-1]
MCGDITDTHIFHSLYGIFYKDVQPYLEWNKHLQKDFEKVLLYFNYANSEEWERFEQGNMGWLLDMGCWLRIVFI